MAMDESARLLFGRLEGIDLSDYPYNPNIMHWSSQSSIWQPYCFCGRNLYSSCHWTSFDVGTNRYEAAKTTPQPAPYRG